MRCGLESYGAEVAVHEDAVLSRERELAGLLGFELDDEEGVAEVIRRYMTPEGEKNVSDIGTEEYNN